MSISRKQKSKRPRPTKMPISEAPAQVKKETLKRHEENQVLEIDYFEVPGKEEDMVEREAEEKKK